MAYKPRCGIGNATTVLHPPANLGIPVPTLRDTVLDPVFGSNVQRVTDISMGGTVYARHEYSRHCAINSDGTKAVIYVGAGYYSLRNLVTGAAIGSNFTAGSVEPEFNIYPNDPGYGYYRTSNTIRRLDLTTGATSLMMTVLRADGSTPYYSLYTHAEGKRSFNGRYWACYGIHDSSWTTRDLLVIDTSTWTIRTRIESMPTPYGDWVSMSPSGTYIVKGSATTAQYDQCYDINGNFLRNLHIDPTHSDMCIGEDGQDWLVYYAVTGSQQTELGKSQAGIARVRLVDGIRDVFLTNYSNWGVHVSGMCSYSHPGWVLVTTYTTTANTTAMAAECILMNLHSGEVRRLCHHHSYSGGYYAEPHGMINWNGDKILVASNWNTGTGVRYEDYLVTPPSGSTFWVEEILQTTSRKNWQSDHWAVKRC